MKARSACCLTNSRATPLPRSPRPILAGLLLLALGLANFARAQSPARPDLTGCVTLPSGNSNVAGVAVLYANLKTGLPRPGETAPGYPILPRRVQTDGQGRFKIESLDPAWLYYVVAIAPGCQFQSFDRVDPAAGPLNATLEANELATAAPDTVLHGRVRDGTGKPVRGAWINMQEVTRSNIWYFSAMDIDGYAISDDAGSFVVHGRTPFTDGGGTVHAAGFATGYFENWTSGETNHELVLTPGATFQGRLVQAGKPVPDVEICLDGFGAESFSTAWTCFARSDGQGWFLFEHLPPNHAFALHGTMLSLAGRGAVPEQAGQVGADGSTTDAGDLELKPAYRMEGRIRLADGKPIPDGSRLLLRRNRNGMGDSMEFGLGKDGTFHFAGVPAESVQLAMRIPGYELTPMDYRLISGSATNLIVTGNFTGLDIVMKPQTRR